MLKYDARAREVQLVADRAYAPGAPVYAWCGPQPNRRLLLNYAIVDDDNPYGARPAGGCARRGSLAAHLCPASCGHVLFVVGPMWHARSSRTSPQS
jgi:hypothetical protein